MVLGILFRPPKGGRNIFQIRLSSKKYNKLFFEAQKGQKIPEIEHYCENHLTRLDRMPH